MEEFNINVLQNHFKVILDNYKHGYKDYQLPYQYTKNDLKIDLHRLTHTKDEIFLHQLEPYQIAFFNIVKAQEKDIRGIKYTEIFNVQGQRMRTSWQNENFAVLILKDLSTKIDMINKVNEERNNNNYKTTIKTKIVTGEVAALFGYYISELKYITGSREQIAKQTANILEEMNIVNTKHEPHKATSIQSQLNTIKSKNNDKILNPKNISKVIELLIKYPKAKIQAEKDYKDY